MRRAFYSLEDFPLLRDLASSWPVMRNELAGLRAPVMNVDRVGKSHGQVAVEVAQRVQAGEPFGWVKGWGAAGDNADWTQYALVIHSQAVPFASVGAQRTQALLAGLPGIKVAAFVRLAPQVLLSTHTHPELAREGLLQMHVTLKAATARNYAYVNVAGLFRRHVEGEALVFDGSLDHFAVNASDEERVILYLEFAKALHYRLRPTPGVTASFVTAWNCGQTRAA